MIDETSFFGYNKDSNKEAVDLVTESIAILAITLCMGAIFVRRQRADYAASLVPILLVPAVHLLATLLLSRYGRFVYYGPYQLPLALADIAALAVSCLCIILLSVKVKSKKNKQLYIVLLTGYNIVLTCAFVYNILHPIVAAWAGK